MSATAAVRRADTFPRWFLVGAGALIVFSLASVALVRITGSGPDQLAARAAREGTIAIEQRALRFEDRPDGGVAVIDGRTGALLTTVQGEQGFLRGALRTLAHQRRARDLGAEQPFQLIAHADGRLTLFDPATGQRIDLESFGPSNAGVFARLLALPAPQAPGK